MKRVLIPLLLTAMTLTSCAKTTPITDEVKPTVIGTQDSTETTPLVKTETTPATNSDGKAENSYTATEVATHKNGLSCWLILDGKVYDVTKFIREHTSDAILRGCGKDATQMFAKHSESAREMKEKFYIGELQS